MLEDLDLNFVLGLLLFLAAFGGGWELGTWHRFLQKRRAQRARMKAFRGK